MYVSLLRQSLVNVQAQWLIVGLFEDQADLPVEIAATPLGALLKQLLDRKDVSLGAGELSALHGVAGLSADSVLIVGLGARPGFDAGVAYLVGFAIGKKLAGKARERVAISLLPLIDPVGEGPVSALLEGVVGGTRGPGLRKKEPNRHPFANLTLVTPPEVADDAMRVLEIQVHRGEIVGEAVNLARDLANTPPSEKPPARIAEQIRTIASDAGIGVQVWDETRIRQERFGGLLGVSAGSDEPPAFVILEYRRGGDSPTLALVGKGVTFDSGGLSLKPSASMEDMKADMTGAAIVAAAMQAIARLQLPVNIVGYLAFTENMTGGRAMKLGDVLTMRNGKTVEVLNTDAEGRLILADALSFAAEGKPGRILDLATLTGSCMVALGNKVAGLFSNDDDFAHSVLASCRLTGERAWRLPMDDDFQEALKSSVADLKNVGNKWGGAITAAKFLEQFVDSTPWVHLDIAGPSWSDVDGSARDQGGTGCFVRTLVKLAEAAGVGEVKNA